MWPLGSADTVCPHWPLMTQIQHWAKTAQTDHVTLRPWPLTWEVTHGACGWCRSSPSIRIPSLKFVGLAVRKIRRTMCVSINGPGSIDLWPWNWYTSRIKGGEPSFQIWAHYAFGMDRRTDKTNAFLWAQASRHTIHSKLTLMCTLYSLSNLLVNRLQRHATTESILFSICSQPLR